MKKEDTFAQEIIDEFGPVKPFQPCAYYDPDGDCIEFLFSNEPSYGKRLDRWVTVFYNRDSNEIVGGLVKGIRELMREFPGLDIEVKEDGRLHLACILRAPAWSQGDPIVKKTYGQVIDQAEAADLYAQYELASA